MISAQKKERRDGPFDIQGGWDFLKKISLFPYKSEKN